MIEIRDLVKQFDASARPAIDHLTLTVPAGEVCVLIGPSGCGKTTTMRVINRMIDPDSGSERDSFWSATVVTSTEASSSGCVVAAAAAGAAAGPRTAM